MYRRRSDPNHRDRSPVGDLTDDVPPALSQRDMQRGSGVESVRVSGRLSRMLVAPGDAAAIFARGASRSGATGVGQAETDDTRALTRSNAGWVKWNHHCGRDG